MGAKMKREAVDKLLQTMRDSKLIEAGLDAAALEVAGEFRKYPPRRYAKQPFTSDKQRRGFFAKLKRGEIEVPYRRGLSPGSKKLGQSWTTERAGPLVRIVGTSVSYARLVQGDQQTPYHRDTGWQTDKQVVARMTPRVRRIVSAFIKKGLA